MWGNLNRYGAITLALFWLACPPLGLFAFDGLQPAGQIALATLLVAATLWISEAVPLFVTSFIVLAVSLVWLVPVLNQSGSTTDPGVFLAPFFSDIILLFLGGFVISAAMNRFRLDEKMARMILVRTGHSIPLMLLAIMGVTAFLSMWLSNTATAAMMLSLCLPIVNSLPAEDRYRTAILLAVPFSANLGGLGTPIGSPPNAIAMQYLAQLGDPPSFGAWMLIGVPGAVGMVMVAWALLLWMYRGRVTKVEFDASPLVIPASPAVLLVSATIAVTILGWITNSLHGFSSGTVALIPLVLLFGFGVLQVKDLRGLSWDVLLIMGGGLCLGRVIEVSGLDRWIVQVLPLGTLGETGLLVAFVVLACVMSSIMSNTATANLLIPVVLGMSLGSVTGILIAIAFSCTMAMPLPISTPPNALAFSSQQLTVRQMLVPGTCIMVIGVALMVVLGIPLWRLVGFL